MYWTSFGCLQPAQQTYSFLCSLAAKYRLIQECSIDTRTARFALALMMMPPVAVGYVITGCFSPCVRSVTSDIYCIGILRAVGTLVSANIQCVPLSHSVLDRNQLVVSSESTRRSIREHRLISFRSMRRWSFLLLLLVPNLILTEPLNLTDKTWKDMLCGQWMVEL